VSFSSSTKIFLILAPISLSGHLTSSLEAPSSPMRDMKSSSPMSSCADSVSKVHVYVLDRLILTSWNSRRETLGTSMLWVDGDSSSSFLPVKMSMATKWTLA